MHLLKSEYFYFGGLNGLTVFNPEEILVNKQAPQVLISGLFVNNKTIKMLSRINGIVLETNEDVLEHPDLINKDPYQKGWLLKIKPSRLNADKKSLLSGSLAKVWLENQVDHISSKISDNYGVVLQDGGNIKNGFAKDLSPENWDILAEEFFQTSD